MSLPPLFLLPLSLFSLPLISLYLFVSVVRHVCLLKKIY
jgi:hypothetical protein